MTPKDWHDKFYYDTEDGDLYYRSTGRIATCIQRTYYGVFFNGRMYMAHRVIWFMTYGFWPECEIDHIDGNGRNNRLENLREATKSQNRANGNWGEDRGLTQIHNGKYRVRIFVDGVEIHLGYFHTKEKARQAYRDAADKYFGEFAYHNRP